MNKELYLTQQKLLNEKLKLSSIVSTLGNFLIENENNFKNEKSVRALKEIRNYFETKSNEYQSKETEYRKIYRELYSTCNHEIALKRSNSQHYQCLICSRYLGIKKDYIPDSSLISIDVTKDYQVGYIIEEQFEKTITSEEDLVETISAIVEDMQYNRNIKVYRRIK